MSIATSPREGFSRQPGQPGPRLPARSVPGCSAHIGRGGHIPEHYLIHLAEGILQFLRQPPRSCLCPSPRGGSGHQQFQAGSDFLLLLFHRPVAAGAVPIAHRMVERRRQVGGSWSPRKGKVECGTVAGLPNLPGSVSKEHHFFVLFCFLNLLYIKKKKTYRAPTVNSCCLCRRPTGPQGLPVRHWKPLLQETESTLCPQHRPPSIAAGTGSEPEEAGLGGKTGTLWNILYNKSLLGKPPMGFSLCPKMAEGGNGPFSSSHSWPRILP